MSDPVRIITAFGFQWDNVRSIFEKHWGILTNAPELKKIVSPSPKHVARRARSLGDMLIKSKFVKETSPTWLSEYPRSQGMFPCNRCQVCPFVHRTSIFTDALGTKTFEIRDLINCSTSWVIYVITCPCPKIYVGKTKRSLKTRIGEHLREITAKGKIPEKPLAKHFSLCHGGSTNGLTVKGIYALKLPPRWGDYDRILLQKENRWVYKLRSLIPVGLTPN